MKEPHVTILQTSFAKRDDTIAFLKEKVPGVKVEFITDSTILADVRANGGPTKAVYDRMKLYAKAAEISGADLIVNSCSTVGEVADEYRKEVSIPVMKIEDPMCQEAAKLGTKFAIFGGALKARGTFVNIRGTIHMNVRHCPQACQLFDRLMSRTVFADGERVVRKEIPYRQTCQRRHAQCGFQII